MGDAGDEMVYSFSGSGKLYGDGSILAGGFNAGTESGIVAIGGFRGFADEVVELFPSDIPTGSNHITDWGFDSYGEVWVDTLELEYSRVFEDKTPSWRGELEKREYIIYSGKVLGEHLYDFTATVDFLNQKAYTGFDG
jgi:hypothetical protein